MRRAVALLQPGCLYAISYPLDEGEETEFFVNGFNWIAERPSYGASRTIAEPRLRRRRATPRARGQRLSIRLLR